MKILTEKEKSIIGQIAIEQSTRPFGYMDREDMQSEIWIICIEALPSYNKKLGPLENFLRKTVKNRLINKFKRMTKPVRSPCPRCIYYNPGKSPNDCKKFGLDNVSKCQKWQNYQLSIESRNGLMNPTDVLIERSDENDLVNKLMAAEIISKIRTSGRLKDEILSDFNKLISGEKITKIRRQKVIDECKIILGESDAEG